MGGVREHELQFVTLHDSGAMNGKCFAAWVRATGPATGADMESWTVRKKGIGQPMLEAA